jgi:hypothetical protein
MSFDSSSLTSSQQNGPLMPLSPPMFADTPKAAV